MRNDDNVACVAEWRVADGPLDAADLCETVG